MKYSYLSDSPDLLSELREFASVSVPDREVTETVSGILEEIRLRGDAALLEKTNDRRHMLALDGGLQLAQRVNRGLAHSAIEVVEARNELCFALHAFDVRMLRLQALSPSQPLPPAVPCRHQVLASACLQARAKKHFFAK